MMKRIITFSACAAFCYILLTGYSSGIAEGPKFLNLTGAGGSTNNCAGSGCHDANSGLLDLSIVLTDLGTGDTVKNGRYFPNGIYGVKLYGKLNITTTNFPKFGFQFTSARANGTFGGDYIMTPGLKANPTGGFEIVEPYIPLNATGFNRFEKTVYWRAPGFGAGNVTLFATLLAANDDGFAVGDYANNVQKTFSENPTSVGGFAEDVEMSVYPNPAKNHLSFIMNNADPGRYFVIVYSASGQVMESRVLEIDSKQFRVSFDAAAWSSGNYFLQISRDDKRKIISFVRE